MTTIQDAARDELADISERVDAEDMELWEERNNLLFEKQRLQKLLPAE